MPITSHSDILSRAAYDEGQTFNRPMDVIDVGFTQEATTIIPFGFAVVQGTAYNQVRLPVDANSVFKGFAVLINAFEKRASETINSDDRFGYPALSAGLDYALNYLSLGRIAVPCSTAMAIGASVFYVYTADGAVTGERVGMVRNSANTLKATQITNARVIEPTTAAGIVVLELF
jgi:hypothetical protein